LQESLKSPISPRPGEPVREPCRRAVQRKLAGPAQGRHIYRPLAEWAETDVGRFHQWLSVVMAGSATALSLMALVRFAGEPGTGLLVLVLQDHSRWRGEMPGDYVLPIQPDFWSGGGRLANAEIRRQFRRPRSLLTAPLEGLFLAGPSAAMRTPVVRTRKQ